MLYLPAVEFEGNEIRLPTRADVLISLLSRFEDQQERNSLVDIFAADPGLFLFSVICKCRISNTSVKSLADLGTGLSQAILQTQLESDAFEVVDGNGPKHWSSYCKWQKRPGQKSLRKFVQSFCDLSGDVIRSGLENTIESTFDFSELKTGQSFDCLLYTSPSPRDQRGSRMPSSA